MSPIGGYVLPGFRPRTTASLSLHAQSKEPQERAPRTLRPQTPRSELASVGPGKGLSSRPLPLRRSKDRCAPSVVRPLAGAGIHWIPAYYPAHPWPWPGRAPCCAPLSVLSLASPVIAFLRYAFLLRLEDRGRPSVVCPFAGPRVHWTLGKSPAHPWRARSAGQRFTGPLA